MDNMTVSNVPQTIAPHQLPADISARLQLWLQDWGDCHQHHKEHHNTLCYDCKMHEKAQARLHFSESQ
jgi:hypothetical protein